jgi:hypothetical protein
MSEPKLVLGTNSELTALEQDIDKLGATALRIADERNRYKADAERLQNELDAIIEPVIRCRDCGGLLMWEKTTEGYEVIHSCHAGKQVREMIAATRDETGTLQQELEALADEMGERCGDHCLNSCRMCEARNKLRLIIVRSQS